jgi:DNA polymerase-1
LPPKKKSASPASDEKPAVELRSPAGSKGPVFLIDAMSFIFRAYHAMAGLRPMSNKAGLPTGAIFIFVNMLRKLQADFRPQYIAAAFDLEGRTFRDEQAAAMPSFKKFDKETQTYVDVEYAGYKATRTATPPDLLQQIPYIRRALDALRVPILEAPGYEADDVIGTLARKAADADYSVFVVSNDKDMMQLVNDRVWVLNPPKDNLVVDPAKVRDLLGVPPERVIDVMALRGDSVDNVPGAPGIGDKGSVDLIQQFGTVEAALDRAEEVQRKTYRESLQNNRGMVLLSKELVTIHCDVPVEFDPATMQSQSPDAEAARALFTELEFNTLTKEFINEAVELGETDYHEAKSAKEVEALLKELRKEPKGILAIAIEPVGATADEEAEEEPEVEPDRQLMLGESAAELATPSALKLALSTKQGSAITTTLDDATSAALKQALEDLKLPKAIHDAKAATHALADRGIALAGVEHDPLLYAYLLDPTYNRYALEDIAFRTFNLKMSDSLGEAADLTLRLARRLSEDVAEAKLNGVYTDIDLPMSPVLARMEHAGIKIDREVLAEMSRRLERDASAKARDIYEKCNFEFNINSPKQLGDVLFNKLNLPKPLKYGKGKTISTAVDVLEGLAAEHDVPRLVLEYRQLTKLKSTYVDALPALADPRSGRVHTTFNMAGSATGRLSSINPNLQNIPIRSELGREIRAAFVAEPGNVLLAADYSQIELRLLAHFSADPLLVEAYRRGDDIHTLTASQVFGVPADDINAEHRRRAKAVNFGIVYGLSAFGLSQQIGIDQKEAKQFIDAYFEKYAGVRAFIDRTLEQARAELKVATLFGRVRPLPDMLSKNWNLRGFAERTAVNTPLQGTAADLIKVAMIRIDAELTKRNLASRMLLQVHDELVFEVPEPELETMKQLVQEQMENVHALEVPLKVDLGTGPNWRDLD